MLRIAIATATFAIFVTAALAEDQSTAPVVTGRSASCDQETPVCGILGKDRLVPYNNECEARQAGAVRVLEGQCFDDD